MWHNAPTGSSCRRGHVPKRIEAAYGPQVERYAADMRIHLGRCLGFVNTRSAHVDKNSEIAAPGEGGLGAQVGHDDCLGDHGLATENACTQLKYGIFQPLGVLYFINICLLDNIVKLTTNNLGKLLSKG